MHVQGFSYPTFCHLVRGHVSAPECVLKRFTTIPSPFDSAFVVQSLQMASVPRRVDLWHRRLLLWCTPPVCAVSIVFDSQSV